MKISRADYVLQAYQADQARLTKQREADRLQLLERKKQELRAQETRTERARRLQLDLGRNVDLDA
jgi:hypothetical protein